jgi:small subunit ribosomal protein S20
VAVCSPEPREADAPCTRIDEMPANPDTYAPFSVPCPVFGVFPLANIKSAKKRARQAVKRNQQNVSQRSQMRTSVKKVLKEIEGGNKTNAEAALKSATSSLDSSASKGLIHKNKASRHKSRLTARIRAMA